MRGRYQVQSSSNNHDRWLVSYADFITLLFAFFVVMFASSQADKSHARAVSEAIKDALSDGGLSPSMSQVIGASRKVDVMAPRPAVVAKEAKQDPKTEGARPPSPQSLELTRSKDTLENSLKPEIERGSVKVALEERGLVISLEAGAFFPSGTAEIAPAAYSAVEKVADVIATLPNRVLLEGHTDSLPISNSRFQSNWELSASRSIGMLRLLSERFGIDSKRMAIVGYADNEALESNQTESGRVRNRRVDIVITRSQKPGVEAPAG